jgi:hypothetical protein
MQVFWRGTILDGCRWHRIVPGAGHCAAVSVSLLRTLPVYDQLDVFCSTSRVLLHYHYTQVIPLRSNIAQ